MKTYKDNLPLEYNPRYDIGPKVILGFINSEKQVEIADHTNIKTIYIPLLHLGEKELGSLKIKLHEALPDAYQEWIVDAGPDRGFGLFVIKNI